MRVPNKYLKWDLNKLIKERDRLKRVVSRRDTDLVSVLTKIADGKANNDKLFNNYIQTLRMKQHIIMLNRFIERQEKKEDES